MRYELIIADIKNYRLLKRTAQDLSNEISGVEHSLYGIKGGSFVDVVVNGEEIRQFFHGGYISEQDKIEKAESLQKQLDKLNKDLESVNKRINDVEHVLKNIDKETYSIIKTIYGGKGWQYAKQHFNRSYSSLQHQMRKAIERIN